MAVSAPTFPRSPQDSLEGIVHLPRMLHKIRLAASGDLHADYLEKMGKGFDAELCQFLGIDFNELRSRTESDASDEDIVGWCCDAGRMPSPSEVTIWSAYLSKKGWRDELSDILAQRKVDLGLAAREDIDTFFDLIDADEGRL